MFIVFFITGLWHGASWNFIVWGMIHGCFLALERMGWSKVLDRLPRIVQHAYTLFVVVIAWVFFRADNLNYALSYLKALGGMGHSTNFVSLAHVDVYMMVVFFIGLVFCTNLRAHLELWVRRVLLNKSWALNGYSVASYFAYIILFIYCTMELAQNNYNPFIYFRF